MSVAARRTPEARAPRSEFLSTLMVHQRVAHQNQWQTPGRDAHLVGRLRRLVSETVRGLATRVGYGERGASTSVTSEDAAFITAHLAEFEWLYTRLADDASRGVLLALLRARLLGQPYSHPTRSQAAYRQTQQRTKATSLVEVDTRRPWVPYLNRYCLNRAGGKMVVQAKEPALLHTAVLEQYAYRHGTTSICAQPGDTIIDGGSHHGVAALHFADRVGAAGHVYAVEMEAGNAALVGENLVLNPRLEGRITVIERALNDESGDRVLYRPHGPATTAVRIDQWGTLSAVSETISVDDLVEQQGIRRLDLLKFDIDGWEHRVLTGARRTLTTLRPSLAISVAHSLADLVSIPTLLDELTDDYALFLEDVTPEGTHPILFGRPVAGMARR